MKQLTIYETLGNHTHYFSPMDREFSERVNANFRNKYMAHFRNEPYGEVSIVPVSFGNKDKVVTFFKGIYVTAWKGEYLLKEHPYDLTFLYYSGLGSKNSSGFGMFEPI